MSYALLFVFIVAMMVWGKFRSDKKKVLAEKTLKEGVEFLEQNKLEEGVICTDSGLQYKVLKQGSGTTKPSPTDTVKVHYHGTLTDGTVFDSSVDRGQFVSFPLNQVITGWTEGLQLMSQGDKFRLYIPAELAYGSRSAGKIPGNSALIFDVELLEIN